MSSYFTLNTIAELVCLLISLFCLFKERNPIWRSFIIYMFLVCAAENLGILFRELTRMNYGIYTVFLLFECGMISVFFHHLYYNYQKRTALILFSWLTVFTACYTIELASHHFKTFPFRTAAFMSVVFVIASCYFYLIMIRDEKFRKLSNYPSFWIVNGILFFYFGGTVVNVFYDYLSHEKLTQLSRSVRYITFNILNILLYGCWSYAFICRYRQRNLYSSSH